MEYKKYYNYSQRKRQFLNENTLTNTFDNLLAKHCAKYKNKYIDDEEILDFIMKKKLLFIIINLVTHIINKHKYNRLLIHSAWHGFITTMKYLSDHNTNSEYLFETTLGVAACAGYFSMVKFLVKTNRDITINPNAFQNTFGTNYFKLRIIKFLIESGADIHANNDEIVDAGRNVKSKNVAKFLELCELKN